MVVAVLLAFVGIGLRVKTISGLGPAEWQAIQFTIAQSALSALLSCALAVPVARALARRPVGCPVYSTCYRRHAWALGHIWPVGRLERHA